MSLIKQQMAAYAVYIYYNIYYNIYFYFSITLCESCQQSLSSNFIMVVCYTGSVRLEGKSEVKTLLWA